MKSTDKNSNSYPGGSGGGISFQNGGSTSQGGVKNGPSWTGVLYEAVQRLMRRMYA